MASDQQNGGLADDADDRSGHGIAAGHRHAADRRHAVRRVRTAAGLDHVYAVEPVSRGAGSGAGVSPEPDDRWTNIYVQSATGSAGSAERVHAFRATTTPLAVNHQGQFPVVTISFNLRAGESLGDAVKAIKQAEQEIGLPLSIHPSFQGTAAAFQNSLANEAMADSGRAGHGLHRAGRVV